jgi:F subunit of K+-transporting ATPase (Potass_KdpF)
MKRHSYLRKTAPTTNYQLPITNSRHKLPLTIFLILSLNIILAPIVYAATDGTWQRTQAYALGILGLVTLGIVIYLFDVVFRPERY